MRALAEPDISKAIQDNEQLRSFVPLTDNYLPGKIEANHHLLGEALELFRAQDR